jgi:hypothetical protein
VFLLVAVALGFAMPSANAATFSPPAPLDFGTVAVGSSTSQVVTITGDPTPSGNNVISNVSLVPGSAFSILGTSCNTVPPPGSCNVTLVFTPVGAGPANGTLQGTETNPATGGATPFTYSLTGTGSSPPPELPEVPAPWALPLVAGALFGASFWILRRRATSALQGGGT